MDEAVIKEAPGSGAIFGFRGKRADRIKLLWWDGQGFCLFYKILERGYFGTFLGRRRRMVLPIWRRPSFPCSLRGSIGADRRGLPLLAKWVKVLILQGIPGKLLAIRAQISYVLWHGNNAAGQSGRAICFARASLNRLTNAAAQLSA
ncbi:IS66 family insertion sequence element accessory protein TnpB [Sinorhizobium meliloti]|uniref:IS66 family insertion sequence element accessory protein TnpB n=1 Tax=Rhizobium meliloti TaxID=382 RepID=UPI001F423158|nr:IS66 family insertion sequence element accessory protein TnpB [Sinorhizobium meliloti]